MRGFGSKDGKPALRGLRFLEIKEVINKAQTKDIISVSMRPWSEMNEITFYIIPLAFSVKMMAFEQIVKRMLFPSASERPKVFI